MISVPLALLVLALGVIIGLHVACLIREIPRARARYAAAAKGARSRYEVAIPS